MHFPKVVHFFKNNNRTYLENKVNQTVLFVSELVSPNTLIVALLNALS